jgi:hypothetical protein
LSSLVQPGWISIDKKQKGSEYDEEALTAKKVNALKAKQDGRQT